MIDLHVHLRDWNQSGEETIYHGLKTALSAGFDCVADMPNTDPPVTGGASARKRLELAEEAMKRIGGRLDYRLYLGLTPDPGQIEEVCRVCREFPDRIIGLKLFASQSTGNMGIVDFQTQRMVYQTLSDCGYHGLLAVHCEKEGLFEKGSSHSLCRVAASEEASVKDQIEHARAAGFGGALHICHVSTKGAVELVRRAKGQEMEISAGATGHHSLYNMDHVPYFKMNPPLRSEGDRKAIIRGLVDGDIDWVESDSAPHSKARILAGASGIPGWGNSLRLFSLLRSLVSREKLFGLFQGNAAGKLGISGCDDSLFSRIYETEDLEPLACRVEAEYPLS